MQCLGKAKWDWNSDDLTRSSAPLGSGALLSSEQLSLWNSQAGPTFPVGLGKPSVYPLGRKGVFFLGRGAGPPREIYADYTAITVLPVEKSDAGLGQLKADLGPGGGISFHILMIADSRSKKGLSTTGTVQRA